MGLGAWVTGMGGGVGGVGWGVGGIKFEAHKLIWKDSVWGGYTPSEDGERCYCERCDWCGFGQGDDYGGQAVYAVHSAHA